ncbi:MAG: GntR family transcriptional regulator [Candidatus Rokubacteria bacterium]|nr:GntR family transcriptional regulator [Candidatus Rokubacteria bacterium]
MLRSARTDPIRHGEGRLSDPPPRFGPLYFRVKEDLLRQIHTGALKPGDFLPPESEICAKYGISRGTLRRALSDLVRGGYLSRKPGAGTYVLKIDFARSATSRFFRFTTGYSSEVIVPAAKLLSQRTGMAPPKVARILNLGPGERVVILRRLRLIDDEPIIVQTSYLPLDHFKDLAPADLKDRLLFDVLAEKFGFHILRADEYLEPSVATPQEAKLLGLRPGGPVILIERIAYTFHNTLIEFRKSVGQVPLLCAAPVTGGARLKPRIAGSGSRKRLCQEDTR